MEYGDVHYLLGNALVLPFVDKEFDYCAAITSLCFFIEPQQALLEMWRVRNVFDESVIMNYLNKSGQKLKSDGQLWPTEEYYQQLEYLYEILNQPVYIIPLHQSQTSLTYSISDKPITLIAIVDYPTPDPENHIFPHMLVFDDGTGLNLGRILRVSINRPFNPEKKDIIYADRTMQKSLMLCERQLNEESIHLASRYSLGEILGLSHNEIKTTIEEFPIHQKSIK